MRERKSFGFLKLTILSIAASACLSGGPLNAMRHSLAAEPADKILRDTWYTITIQGNIPYGYYNETLELRKGRLFVQSHVWKQEGDFVNEEQIGAYAENTPELKPLFYNFHATYRSSEVTIDGTVAEKNAFSARIRRGNDQLPIAKRTLPKITIFSQFFPVWVSRQLPKLSPGKSAVFTSLIEDSHENGFMPETGRMKLEKPDELAKQTRTRKISVDYQGVLSNWWVEDTGEAVRIEMPARKTVVNRVKKSEALEFLKSRTE